MLLLRGGTANALGVWCHERIPKFRLDSETKELLNELRDLHSEQINDNREEEGTNINFKTEVVVISLTIRLLDLVDATVLLAKKKHYVPAIILSRCCLETSAVLAFVHRKLLNYFDDGDEKCFEESLDKIAVGTRDAATPFEAINILTIIDKLGKEFPKIRLIYDGLSEYAHPNWAGTFGSYLKVDKSIPGFQVGSLGKVLENDLKPCLSISVGMAVLFRRRIEDAISDDK